MEILCLDPLCLSNEYLEILVVLASLGLFPLQWYPQLLVIVLSEIYFCIGLRRPFRDMGGGGWIWGYKRGLYMYVPCM